MTTRATGAAGAPELTAAELIATCRVMDAAGVRPDAGAAAVQAVGLVLRHLGALAAAAAPADSPAESAAAASLPVLPAATGDLINTGPGSIDPNGTYLVPADHPLAVWVRAAGQGS